MPILRPALVQPVTGDSDIVYPAREIRGSVLGSIFSREGVLDYDAGHFLVGQRGAGANYSVDVAAGRAAIFGDDTSDQGTYLVTSTTTVNVAVPTPSSSTSRTHRLILRVRDRVENAAWPANTYDAILSLQADTAAGVALPATAIPLATITTPANAASVTTAMIDGSLRKRSSVGTPWLSGNLIESGIHSSYGGRDGTRPLTYQKSPDGFVTLSGWIRRSGASTNLAAGQIYNFDGTATIGSGAPILPPEIRPSGIRDIPMMTDLGACNLAVYPNGSASFRFQQAATIAQNQTWFSLDGCVYRAAAFS